mgnify:CR=1 FL=1
MSRSVSTVFPWPQLSAAMSGELVLPDHAGYDAAREVWNGMIDRRPAAIARCQSVEDVQAAVNFAREQGLEIAIRGGGHNGPGLGSVDNGLVVDLSHLRDVRVTRAWSALRVMSPAARSSASKSPRTCRM